MSKTSTVRAKRKPAAKPPGAKRPAATFAPTPEYAAQVVEGLKKEHPDATCALVHKNAFELLVATILSAQCTDERVNLVTKELFAKAPTPAKMAALPMPELERIIQSTGFFRNKAKSIHQCSVKLVEEHRGQVPREIETLVKLPGVGRKTANVVLGTAYRIPSGVVVDTHVTRVANRLGLTRHHDALKIEQDLMKLLPEEEWIDFSHRTIWHGRRICTARRAYCERCALAAICPKIGVQPGK